MLQRVTGRLLLLTCAALLAARSQAAPWTVEQTTDRVSIKLDGQLVAEYLVKSGAKPIVWPLLGPTGKPHTRAYPMEKGAGETQDHPHQRSCWFTHGDVNGIDFWGEGPGHGLIEHQGFDEVAGGETAVVAVRNAWIGPDKRKHCEDRRRITFSADADSRTIDFDLTLKASDGPVVFGDTKEGCFGFRVAQSIAIDGKQGGQIVNSNGQANEQAWGKAANWVDYSGNVDGERLGIAVLNHPDSFRAPTYWHVRPYGLFAANPFGVNAFTGAGNGAFTLPAGESLRLQYRVVLHRGDEKQARIAARFADYARPAK